MKKEVNTGVHIVVLMSMASDALREGHCQTWGQHRQEVEMKEKETEQPKTLASARPWMSQGSLGVLFVRRNGATGFSAQANSNFFNFFIF